MTAHDFLADGGEAIATTLAGRADTVADTTDSWTADSLRCRWLGIADACAADEAAATPDLVSPNSHWTHYASLSANGFTSGDHSDILTSEEVGTTSAPAPQLVFTIGCHAGFSVPDDQSLDGSAHGVNPQLDFAQALAQRQAVFVASTGFGLGETEGLAGTEQLMADFTAELLSDGVTAGEALLAAKRSYAGALSTTSTYDVKSLVQQTLYGPPQYQVFDDAGSATPLTGTASTTAPAAADGPLHSSFDENALDDGRRYWSVAGDVQITPGRPWQPRVVLDALPPDTHGVLITDGHFEDRELVDPVVTRPTMEWEQGTGNLDGVCHDSWWPADLTTVNEDSLVVVPGQFRCRDATTGAGTQRLYDTLELDVLDPVSSDDFTPPSAGPLELRGVGSAVEVSFPASDLNGITRIVPLVFDVATGEMRSVDEIGPVADPEGVYTVVIPDVTAHEEFVIQVVDGENNVTTLTGRGANLRYLQVDADSPVTPDNGLATFSASLTGWDAAVGDIEYIWYFGDGTTTSGVLRDESFDDQGRFHVDHTYAEGWDGGTATLRVWDGDGAMGTVDVQVEADGNGLEVCDVLGDITSPDLAWGDLVGCAVTEVDGVLSFSVGLAAPVANDGSYRIEVDTAPGRKKPSISQFKYEPETSSWTGPSSLVVTESDDRLVLTFTVGAREIGWKGGKLAWRAFVQSGVPGSSGDGIVDRYPDAGTVSWSPSG